MLVQKVDPYQILLNKGEKLVAFAYEILIE